MILKNISILYGNNLKFIEKTNVLITNNTFQKINSKKNCVIGFGITDKTISKLKTADGLVVGSAICKEITKSLMK